MRVWKKIAAAKSEDAWFERLRFIGEQRIVITAFPGKKTVCVEVYGTSVKESRALLGEFGGKVRVIQDRAPVQPPPRAPIRVRRKLLVVASERERAEYAVKFPDRKIAVITPRPHRACVFSPIAAMCSRRSRGTCSISAPAADFSPSPRKCSVRAAPTLSISIRLASASRKKTPAPTASASP
jgi:hypothetical protein